MQLEEIARHNRATRQMQRFLCTFCVETTHPLFHSLRQHKCLNIQGEKRHRNHRGAFKSILYKGKKFT